MHDAITEILRQIDASSYVDPQTGDLHCVLSRGAVQALRDALACEPGTSIVYLPMPER